MPRLSMKCECGWSFFIPDSTQGWEVSCPNCRQPVAIPGRKVGEGAPVSAGELAARLQDKNKTLYLAIGGGVALLIVAVIAVVLMSGTDGAPEDEGPNPNLTGARRAGTDRAPAPRPPPPPPPPVNPDSDAARQRVAVAENVAPEAKRLVTRNLWLCSLAGVASEVLLLRGHAALYQDLQRRMSEWEAALVDAVRKLNESGEKTLLEPHFQAGDRVVAIAQRDLRGLRAADASEILARWLSEFQAGRPTEMVSVMRGGLKLDLYLVLPEATPELIALAKEAPAAGRGTAGDPSPDLFGPSFNSGAPVATIPKASIEDVQARLAALPADYVNALPSEERTRLKKILLAKEGTDDDRAFIEVRIRSEALPLFEKEATQFRLKKNELAPKIKESTAIDVIHFKGSRPKLECVIVKQTPEQLTVKYGGVQGALLVEDIDRIERGAGAGAQFPAELKKSGEAMPGLGPLLEWCQAKRLKVETEYVAYSILVLQPLHEPARRALNLRPPAFRTAGPYVAPPLSSSTSAPTTLTVVQKIEQAATEVVARFPTLPDVIRQMHLTGSGFVYKSPIEIPSVAQKPVAIIVNPLTFRFESLNAVQALELGQWWAPLSVQERTEFARFYGLWVASKR